MARRSMPSIYWARGKRIANSHKVKIMAIQQDQAIKAKVYGSEPYTTILGKDPKDDYCSCPFFPGHGYCKHIAAVEAYFVNQGLAVNDVIKSGQAKPASPVQQLPVAFRPKQSSGSKFLQQLGLPPLHYYHGLSQAAEAIPLALQVTLGVGMIKNDNWQQELHFSLALHVTSRFGSNHFYVVSDFLQFLRAYLKEAEYATNGKASFVLAHQAFKQPERTLLDRLTELPELNLDKDADAAAQGRELMLPFGVFDQIAPLLAQLAHFEFNLFPEKTYDRLEMAEFTPDAGLFAMQIRELEETSASSYQVVLTSTSDLFMPQERLVIKGSQCLHLSASQQTLIRQLFETTVGFLQPEKRLNFAPYEQDQIRALAELFAKIGEVQGLDLLKQVAVTAHFDLTRSDNQIDLKLSYDYGDRVLAADTPADQFQPRNLTKEQQTKSYLESLGFKQAAGGYQQAFASSENLYHFFKAILPNLQQNGTVTVAPALAALLEDGSQLAAKIAVSEEDGLLSISFTMKGIQPSEVDQMLQQLNAERPFITRSDGTIVMLDQRLKRVAASLAKLRRGALHHGRMQVPASQVLSVEAALGKDADFDDKVKQIAADLMHPGNFKTDNKMLVNATLRPYQIAGVQWLEMLNAHGFGGILADEMGLGKTLEMITFLMNHRVKGHPSLIVAPASLLYNWAAECEKFAPDLQVAVVDGSKQAREALIASKAPEVLIASYNSASRDIAAYEAIKLNYLVLDEAQYVKNGSAKTNQNLRKLKPKCTFALSGTPIENRTSELWALFALVMPGLLPSQKKFNQMAPEEVATWVAPFILRREKKTVLKDLPPLEETNLTNEMTKAQKTVYLAQLKQMQVKVQGLSSKGLVRNKLEILAGLTRLRQLCDTPALYVKKYRGGSGKLDQLEDLIKKAAENGRRVLIFSQFTGMLAKIEAQLNAHHQPHFLLEGATPVKSRLSMVDAFNQGERQFFLISLKAGGTGLNLTAADMVILVDLWWNPAVEDQAVARAHRIGQKHQVDVYRLITKGTIEEQIVKLQAKKRDLVDQVLSGAKNKGALTEAEIREILGISQ